MFLLLGTIPLLELEISTMRHWPRPLSLEYHEDDRANNRYEIEREVQKVSDQSRRRELLEGLLRDLPKLAHEVTATFDLSALRYETCGVLGDQHTVKGVYQRVLDQERLAEDSKEGAGFRKHEQSGRNGSERARCERHYGHLRQICECEHGRCDPQA